MALDVRAHQLQLPLLDDAAKASELPFELPEPVPSAAAPSLLPPPRALKPRQQLLERARTLASVIASEIDKPVRLYVTDNRATMVSFRRGREALTLRVHHMFLEAPQDVVAALTEYAGRGNKRAGALIDAFVRDNSDAIRPEGEGGRNLRLVTRGEVYDLQDMFDRLNAVEFDGAIRARIGWGKGAPNRRRRSIRMGVYDHLTKTIRVHPALDRVEVPRFFVEYIVFHEMLHQAIPCKDGEGRRQHHSPEFKEREARYPDYARAIAWEQKNLHILLGRSRRMRGAD